MRLSCILSVALSMLFLASCHKDVAPGTVKVQFQPTWGTDNLKLNTVYSTPDGKYLSFDNVDMYLSHIRLVRTDGTEVEAKSAVLLSYQDAAITFDLSSAAGSYKAIKFGIGLDSTQNKVSPADVPSTDPVFSSSALYWDADRLHLFIQVLGHSGTTPTLGSIFFYHEGNDSINTYRTATITKNFSIADGQATSLTLDADLKKVFYGAGAIDVIAMPATHTRDHPYTATVFADAFAQIFSLQ